MRVVVDYNQKRVVQDVRLDLFATPQATVLTPVTWDEVEAGIEIEDSASITFAKASAVWAISGTRY